MVALTDVTITRRGGDGPITARLNDVAVSWEVNHAGTFSGGLQVEQLSGLGLEIGDLLSRWISWQHPLLGTWAGVITGVEVGEQRTIALTGETFHCLLKKKFYGLAKNSRNVPDPGAAGALFKRMFNDAVNSLSETSDSLFLTLDSSGTYDGGPNIEVDWLWADFYDDIIPALTEEIDYEWRVSPERVISFGKWLGADRGSVVKLTEGREISTWSVTQDREELDNLLVGYGTYTAKAGKFEKDFDANTVRVANPESIARHGVLGVATDYGQVKNQNAIKEFLEGEGKRAFFTPFPLTIECVPIGLEWTRFRESDVIRVVLSSAGIEADFRVMVRAYDSSRGVMTLAGDLWPDGYPSLPDPYVPYLPPESKPTKGNKKKRKKKRKGKS